MSGKKRYSAQEIADAASLIDHHHGRNSYDDGQIAYPPARRLMELGADIVALAKLKITRTPDYPDMSYEFLFEECREHDMVELSHDLAAGVPLEIIRSALAWTHCWKTAHQTALAWLASHGNAVSVR